VSHIARNGIERFQEGSRKATVRRACGQGVAIHPSTRDQHPADENVDNAGMGKREGAQCRSQRRTSGRWCWLAACSSYRSLASVSGSLSRQAAQGRSCTVFIGAQASASWADREWTASSSRSFLSFETCARSAIRFVSSACFRDSGRLSGAAASHLSEPESCGPQILFCFAADLDAPLCPPIPLWYAGVRCLTRRMLDPSSALSAKAPWVHSGLMGYASYRRHR